MTYPKIQTIGDYRARWGEGPIWWQDRLLYVDIEGHKLIRLDPDTGREEVWDVGERIGTVVPTSGKDLVYAGDTGFVRFDPESGKKTPLADPESDKRPQQRFNDGKCDPAGRFWAGTINSNREPEAALYCLDTDGTVSLKLAGVTNSNGICWSLDGGTLYYIDTPTKKVRAYRYDRSSGGIDQGRDLIDTAEAGYDSSPDGMTIDAKGRLWIAFCHGGCVVCFDPQSGVELEKVVLPCRETTACAFGGPGLERLFVTTGVNAKFDEPEAGRLFVIDGLGAVGSPAFPFAG